MLNELGYRHSTKPELLTAGEDRGGNRLGFGSGENKNEMLGRLLDDLEQRIKGLTR